MKISNFSKIMLIAAMALAGNAAYKMLHNRTSCCATASECTAEQTSCCEQAVEQAPIADATLQEVAPAPIQTAMMDDQYGDQEEPQNSIADGNDDDNNDNNEDGGNDEDSDDADDIP